IPALHRGHFCNRLNHAWIQPCSPNGQRAWGSWLPGSIRLHRSTLPYSSVPCHLRKWRCAFTSRARLLGISSLFRGRTGDFVRGCWYIFISTSTPQRLRLVRNRRFASATGCSTSLLESSAREASCRFFSHHVRGGSSRHCS